jgi:hypothetical protein
VEQHGDRQATDNKTISFFTAIIIKEVDSCGKEGGLKSLCAAAQPSLRREELKKRAERVGRVSGDADCLAEGSLVEQLFQRHLVPADHLAAHAYDSRQGLSALHVQCPKPANKR